MLHAHSRPSRKSSTKSPISLVGWAEARRRSAKAKADAELIASALADAPRLDRESMSADQFPFNEIASSDRVIAVVDKLVKARLTGNPWITAHKALLHTDQNGHGYATFTDAFRDAAFQVGVDYALRSSKLPEWWTLYEGMDARTKAAVAVVINYAAKGGAR